MNFTYYDDKKQPLSAPAYAAGGQAGNEQGRQDVPEEVLARIENNFTYHPPFGSQSFRYGVIRDEAKRLAKTLVQFCPESRELSVALTNLESCVHWANSAIACNEKPLTAHGAVGTTKAGPEDDQSPHIP